MPIETQKLYKLLEAAQKYEFYLQQLEKGMMTIELSKLWYEIAEQLPIEFRDILNNHNLSLAEIVQMIMQHGEKQAIAIYQHVISTSPKFHKPIITRRVRRIDRYKRRH